MGLPDLGDTDLIVPRVGDEERALARQAVLRNAHDTEDAGTLLAMLGLEP